MKQSDIDLLWDVVFDAKVWAEDAIDLERNGHPQGFKKGVLQRKLKAADKALKILNGLGTISNKDPNNG